MITRRKGLTLSSIDAQLLDVEVTDAVETVESLQSPPECLSTEDFKSSELELDDLFGIDDLRWTFENPDSPLFDMGSDVYSSKELDSRIASKTPSPERLSCETKTRHSPSAHMTNKNAIAARLNRLKKKEYISGLEKKVGFLSTENHMLKQENSQLSKRVEELEDETRYLRAVLANESMLAQLLSRLSGVNGMKLSSSLFQGASSNDHDYALPRKRVKVEEKETAAGVCLHVDKNHVSVEFCTKCAESASMSLKM